MELEPCFDIHIRLAAEQQGEPSWPIPCQVTIRDQDNQLFRECTIALQKPFSDHQESELSWYLESYAQHDVFATKRAAVVEANIASYAQSLSKFLLCDTEPNEWAQGAIIRVNISSPASISRALHTLHWELVESTAYWPELARPKAVVVVRQVIGVGDAETPVQERNRDDFTNILLVSARPQLDKDVPHMLASAMLWSVLEDLPPEKSAKTHVTIERSGTFENFTALLKKYEPGHFDIIHLDLHGTQTDLGVALVFLQNGTEGICPDRIAGDRLARLLGERKVGSVIMNSCRSAASHSVIQSLAEKLVGEGIPNVIGMSFDAIASSMEQFIFTLYDAHLSRGLNLPTACHAARLMLDEHRGKTTRYGSTINVLDAFVPVCFVRNVGSIMAPALLENKRLVSISRDQITGLAPAEDLVFGRENDLLLIETNLQWSSRVIILQGPAGIGKTLLCSYVCTWWMRTRVIDKIAIVQLSSIHQSSNSWPGFKTVVAWSLNLDLSSSWDTILERLRTERYCICIDSLESMILLDSKARLTLRKDIKYLVKHTANSQTVLIFTSRRNESWISSNAYIHPVRGMNPAATMQYIRSQADELGFDFPHDDPEQLRYLGKIARLLDRNPLAIHAVLRNFDDADFQTLYYRLMAGNMVLGDVSWAEDGVGFRSIIELSNMISELDNLRTLNSAHQFIDANTALTDDERRAYTSIQETLSRYDLPGNCFPPFHLGFFWNKIPAEGLPQYIAFFNLEMLGFEQIANILASYPGADFETLINQASLNGFSEMSDQVLLPMQRLGFISTHYESLSSSRTEAYYQIHPLLTLLARDSVVFKTFSTHLANAFVKFHGYRLKKWPWKYEYGNAIWQPYLGQASLDFPNHVSAVLLLFAVGYSTFWTHVIFKRLVLSIQKSLVNSLDNQFIVADIWRRIWNAMLGFPKEYFYLGDDNRQLLEVTTVADFTVPSMTAEEKEDISLHYQHSLFYERKYLLAQISMSIIAWQAHEQADKTEEDRQNGLRVLRDAPHPLGTIKDPELIDWVQKLARRAENNIQILQRLGVDRDSLDDWRAWWKDEGDKLMSEEFAIFNVEKVPHDRYSTPKGERPWDKIPIHLNPTSAIIMSFVRIKETVEDFLETKDFAKAREVIGDALYSEINFRGDHAITKVKLLELLARVEETCGNWGDAFQRRRDAEELEDSLPAQPSRMKIMERSLRLARAAERYGEVHNARMYVNKVLRIANEAALEANHQIEIEAMKGLYKLDIANTLDGDISAVFLLIRGAKSDYRLHGSGQRLGEWFTSLWELQGTYGGWWILGPPDQRVQSMLISNALRIFGLLIPQYGTPELRGVILNLIFFFAKNNDEENLNLLFCDLEERLFGAPDTQPGCRLVTENLKFPQQRALFEFIYEQGIAHLKRTTNHESLGDVDFPRAPYTATGPDGNTIPPGFVFPTEMMLKLAGYIVS